MSLKKVFHNIHLVLGLVSGLIVFLVAISGCIYVFEEEARVVFQNKYYYVSPQNIQTRHTLTAVTAQVKRSFPNEVITQIRIKELNDAAIIYHTKTDKAISINPYTLVIIGERNLKTDFFNWIEEFHTKLHLGDIGEVIIKVNVLLFFILCISGLIIWWPKQKAAFKKAVTIKFNANSWKKLNWDLHSVLGFYALFVLIIISFTGMFWVFDVVKETVAFATNSKVTNTKAPKLLVTDNDSIVLSMDAAYAIAAKQYPGANYTIISMPKKVEEPLRVLLRFPYTIVRKQHTIFYNQYTGKKLREDLYTNYTPYDKVMRSNYDFHTGRIRALGIGSKIIYFLASLFAASLPITGTLIWWNRYKKSKRFFV